MKRLLWFVCRRGSRRGVLRAQMVRDIAEHGDGSVKTESGSRVERFLSCKVLCSDSERAQKERATTAKTNANARFKPHVTGKKCRKTWQLGSCR